MQDNAIKEKNEKIKIMGLDETFSMASNKNGRVAQLNQSKIYLFWEKPKLTLNFNQSRC